MLTAQNIYDSFVRYKRDVADVDTETGLFLEWVQFTTRYIYDKVKRIDAKRYIKEKSYTVVTDPDDFTLETDFGDLRQTDCGLYFYNTDDSLATDTKLGLTSYGKTDKGYYLEANKIYFTGIENETYVMRYLPVPPTIDALTDYISTDATATGAAIVEDRHLEYFVKAIDVLYEQWDNNSTQESIADFRFVRALDDLLDGFNRQPQISVMKNPINNF